MSTQSIVAIDPNSLDSEWVKQPRLVEDIGKSLAVAKRKLAEAKDGVELAESEVANIIRKDPDRYVPGGKSTEGAIKEQIPLHKKVIKAKTLQRKRQFKVDLLQSLMSALEHKKKALEDLVYLHGASYFGNPKMNKHMEDDARQNFDIKRKKKIRKSGELKR